MTLLAFLLIAGGACAQIIVSNTTTVPVNATINQSSFSDASNVQARDQTGSVRAVSQTFTWNSTQALDGLGLRLATAQNTLNPYTSNSTWVLDIQQLSGNGLQSAANIVSTVAHLSFTLPASAVSPESYIYFDLTTNLSLTNGGTYGFILYPETASDTFQRLFFSRSANTSVYSGGVASQVSSVTGPGPYSGSYGGQGYDLGFYLVAVPEPGACELIVIGLCTILLVLRARTRTSKHASARA
ncbi:hypothetical protein DB345_00470 [Spartobacteria bacterium LR76]|nr:hypothetical protein DB345_00470 [Spartobacteria bacterium LR76]